MLRYIACSSICFVVLLAATALPDSGDFAGRQLVAERLIFPLLPLSSSGLASCLPRRRSASPTLLL
jgi:hypothetical protein